MKTGCGIKIGPALAHALQAAPAARKIFDTMPPSHQREYERWIGAAKKAETRAARAEKAVAMIKKWQR